MNVTIRVTSFVLPSSNQMKVVEANGSTVGECLEAVVRKFPESKAMLFDKDGKLQSYISVYVNDMDSYPEELAKPVKDRDVLSIVTRGCCG